ncbi:heterokaryon incompatibility protein-domain-containing protein [Mariannaea sp. PMI_226]|nr:heterokaryon incompatibility protein-domain-containing protein [Mariannaea sp. PMI_226]
MRLIEARTLNQTGCISFAEFYSDIPKYAILSHTWDGTQEVAFQACNSAHSKLKTGYDKIRKTCELAQKDGIEYVWVDTCCIDKSSSTELTEAINSMFQWYQQASVCYVYLADKVETSSLEDCRWFSRGWTLQELIAPKSMKLFNSSWNYIGSKDSLMGRLSSITSIDADILSQKAPLSSVCIAKRLSWAAGPKTTRVEDMAYCLLGICNINMPMLYGEGQRAFYRLQEEIIRSTYDSSLLAWTPSDTMGAEFCGFLAKSVNDFVSCSKMYSITNPLLDAGEMSISNKCLRLRVPEYILEYSDLRYRYALKLNCMLPGYAEDFLTIPMRKIGPNTFIRARGLGEENGHSEAEELAPFCLEPVFFGENELHTITLLTELPSPSVQRGLTRARSCNIVSSSRFTVVQIELPPEIPQIRTDETPIKFWDVEDCLFFGTHNSFQNWGAIALDESALFVCFWCKKGNRWMFRGTLLKTDSEGVDDFWKHLFLFAEEFGYEQPTIRNLLKNLQEKEESSVRIKTKSQWCKFSFRARRADNRNFCSGPRWKVVFKQEFSK